MMLKENRALKLLTYSDLPHKKELWDLYESITEYKEFSFTSFNELLFFIKENGELRK
jgi:hypothetical protein